ncbi:hypothetical protein BamMEX5DRAFT_1115 [Burkholderia ambifaria MEX-5]|uniref:Uncharacterized protein n=1 Tax=Burkholderia ambifaria MEX-5 TaxID=396597 RepID=B1T030_9BURK|nr:hypothetical protein BamMEX5DRAFT_1115 [Burkholderia ambifaria MEX-5]
METICQEHTICFELMKGVPPGLVAIVVAIASWVIAHQQIRVAKGKLNLDLFQARYEMFTLTWSYLNEVTRGRLNEGRSCGSTLPMRSRSWSSYLVRRWLPMPSSSFGKQVNSRRSSFGLEGRGGPKVQRMSSVATSFDSGFGARPPRG